MQNPFFEGSIITLQRYRLRARLHLFKILEKTVNANVHVWPRV